MNSPEAQASWYVARLYSGEMTRMDEENLFSWLRVNRAHRRAYEEVLAIWDAAGELRKDLDLMVASKAPESRARTWRGRAGWTAAAAITLLVTIPPIMEGIRDRSEGAEALASYATAIGEQRVVTLEDGSRVTLNTNSRVLVDYTPRERRIILDFGEAFFEIERDSQRPLAVSALGQVVFVLGTKFNVLLEGGDVKVAVVEGLVAVSDQAARFPFVARQVRPASGEPEEDALSALKQGGGPNHVILRAGSMATCRDGSEWIVEEDAGAVNRIQSWRSGRHPFRQRTLVPRSGRTEPLQPDQDPDRG